MLPPHLFEKMSRTRVHVATWSRNKFVMQCALLEQGSNLATGLMLSGSWQFPLDKYREAESAVSHERKWKSKIIFQSCHYLRVCFNWILWSFLLLTRVMLFYSITDPYESLVLSVISRLLIDGPVSPFYQALLDSNIGSDYSPTTGYVVE